MTPLYNEQFLPAELQTQIGALRAAGVPDALLASHIETILAQMEAKTTKVQLDVWRIEESLGERVEKAITKQDADLRTQLGETNGILSELLGGQREQGAAMESLRTEFHHGLAAIGERVSDIEGRTMQLEQTVAAHAQSRDQSIEDRRMLRKDMDESKQHRARIQHTLDTELPAISEAIRAQDMRHSAQISAIVQRLLEIERLLEPAGNHDHDSGGGDG